MVRLLPALHLCESPSEGARTDPAIRAMEHRSPVRRQFCQPGVHPLHRVRKPIIAFQPPLEVQQFSGIAPVTERSGKTIWVHRRLACPKFVLQTFHEFANQSRRFCVWSKLYYQQQRARGKQHNAAVRALAYKWIRILFRCWKDRRLYDDSRYEKSLIKRGASLAPLLNVLDCGNGVQAL